MSIKPIITELPIKVAKSGFYRGFSLDVTLSAKIVIGLLVVWAVAFPDNAGRILGDFNSFILHKTYIGITILGNDLVVGKRNFLYTFF